MFRQHGVCDRLREEVRPEQVGAYELVEALFGALEEIGTRAGAAPRVVDERRDRAELGGNGRQQRRAILAPRDVRHEIPDAAALCRELTDHLGDSSGRTHTAQREVPPVSGQRACDAEADTTRAAGDEGERTMNSEAHWSGGG